MKPTPPTDVAIRSSILAYLDGGKVASGRQLVSAIDGRMMSIYRVLRAMRVAGELEVMHGKKTTRVWRKVAEPPTMKAPPTSLKPLRVYGDGSLIGIVTSERTGDAWVGAKVVKVVGVSVEDVEMKIREAVT
jgi:hypothetical protein